MTVARGIVRDSDEEATMKIGPTEILVLVLVITLLFGASRLPKLARAMREARHEFEKGSEETADEAKDESEG